MLEDVGMVVPKIKETRSTIANYAFMTMLYSSEFRVHATTKMNYNSCMRADKG